MKTISLSVCTMVGVSTTQWHREERERDREREREREREGGGGIGKLRAERWAVQVFPVQTRRGKEEDRVVEASERGRESYSKERFVRFHQSWDVRRGLSKSIHPKDFRKPNFSGKSSGVHHTGTDLTSALITGKAWRKLVLKRETSDYGALTHLYIFFK